MSESPGLAKQMLVRDLNDDNHKGEERQCLDKHQAENHRQPDCTSGARARITEVA